MGTWYFDFGFEKLKLLGVKKAVGVVTHRIAHEASLLRKAEGEGSAAVERTGARSEQSTILKKQQ